jgi:gliding motility-associated protein GldM
LQSDIRHIEGRAVRYLLTQTDASDLRVNKFNAYVIPSSDYVVQGNKYRAQIVLAAIDSTQAPEYYVNGKLIAGNGIYEIVANKVGKQKITGKIGYKDQKGEMQYLPFEREYMVGEPSATISNTELNIMYRGYKNPFSISVPGVSNQLLDVKCSGASVSKNGDTWIIVPGANSPDKMSIEVYAKMGNSSRMMGSHTYRIKNLPPPNAYFEVNGVPSDSEKQSLRALTNPNNKLIASYGTDGLVQAKFDIVSFYVKLPSGFAVSVKGDRMDKRAISEIRQLQQGNQITIMNIKAKGPDGREIQLRSLPIELR